MESARTMCKGEFQETQEELLSCKCKQFSQDEDREQALYFNVVSSVKP